MTHIANQRIKQNGKIITAGSPITLTDDELADLPEGAVSAVSVNDTPENPDPAEPEDLPPFDISNDAHLEKLTEAVLYLPDDQFKKDGAIRKDSLAALTEVLGFSVTAEDVAAAKPAPENG